MNFAAFQTGGTGFVTGAQLQHAAKLQQNVAANGATLSQVVGMVGGMGAMSTADGVQYVRTLDASSLQPTQQLITLPIALPGAKPGDPQQTVQIQVLSPNLLQSQQQPKYQMQIPIQGGAVLTLAYSPDVNDGIQILGNSLPEGVQLLAALPQDMQLLHQAQSRDKEQSSQTVPQVFIQNQQIVINNPEEKLSNNMNNNNNSITSHIVIKEECDEMTNDEESSQGAESVCDGTLWQGGASQEIVNYLNKLPQQQAQVLPASLQQFLKLNSAEPKDDAEDSRGEDLTEAIISEDGSVRIKKKKKYKKKPPRPARPKPGQVVISSAEDGTPLYGCPECSTAYPLKEQLELHLIVHKIERRFICGICGAGLKRKEHLERHKLGHNPERPYVCGVCRKGFKRREHLNLHTVIHSGVKTEVCQECGKGFYRKDHLRKHTRSHETKRAREEALSASGVGSTTVMPSESVTSPVATKSNLESMLPEITIHVPTSSNMQVPVQINIPQNVLTTLQAQQNSAQHSQLDALLAQHT